MRATLIVVNYNGCDLLATSVPAALAAAHHAGDCSVMVADDGSTDDSVALVSTTYPGVRFLALRHAGFGPTCNAAVAAADTDIVVLLNSDVVVSEDFLPPLLEGLDARDVFAAGCKFLNPDGTLTDTLGNRTSCRWHRGVLHIHHETDPDRLADTCPQLYANGGAMAVRRARWLELGGFDDMYRPGYWEDVDLGYRAWGRGWRVLYEPASVVFHEQGSTMRRAHRQRQLELVSAKNAVLFTWKNILDRRLLRRTLAAQAIWACDDILIGGLPPRTGALAAAFGQLHEAARGRAREQRERARSDGEIMADSGGPS